MNQQAMVKNNSNNIQSKRREIQLRREKAHAVAQYKRISGQAWKASKVLPSKEPASINHAVFFTICLGVASVMMPQLMGLAIIFSVLILGHVLSEQFSWFQKNEVVKDNFPKQNISSEKMIRMVRPDVVKLSHKKKVELPVHKTKIPVHKTEAGSSFTGEDGVTITQFDWRQLSEAK
jgi:hypothetical protein